MTAELIRIITEDNVEIAGLLFDSSSNHIIIHMHGCGGNFYENRFIDSIAEFSMNARISFLSINSRYHDHICEIKRFIGGVERRDLSGFSYELFEDCIQEIDAIVRFLKKRGYRSIIFCGHSTAPSKIIHYLSRKNVPELQGMIFLGFNDDYGMQKKILKKSFDSSLQLADDWISSGKSGETFLYKYLNMIPITAASYKDKFGPSSAMNNFPLNRFGDHSAIEKITVPILCIYGEKEQYLDINVKDSIYELRRMASNCPDFRFAVIKDCEHSFSNAEVELAEIITKWSVEVLENG